MWNLAFLILGIIMGIFLALDYRMIFEFGKYGHFRQKEFKGNWITGLRSRMEERNTKTKTEIDIYFSASVYIPAGVYIKTINTKYIK